MRVWLLYLAVLTAIPSLATARKPAPEVAPTVRNRNAAHMHFVTPQLVERLSPEARRNARGTATFFAPRQRGAGSAVVVDREGGSTLVLTNAHVMIGAGNRGTVRFSDGTVGTVSRVVARSLKLDYALVEVESTTAPRISTAHLRRGPVRPGEAVYTISGAGDLSRRRVATTTGPARRAMNVYRHTRREGGLATASTIQLGHETAGGEVSLVHPTGARYATPMHAFDYPNAPGHSGSAVFSRGGTQQMVALHASGNRRVSGAVPLRAIRADLAARLEKVPEDVRGRVLRLLDQ